MLIKEAGPRKVNYRFLSLHFPLLGIETANTETRQTETSNLGEGYVHILAWSRRPHLKWDVLPVNSVGRAEEREQKQMPFTAVSPELAFSRRWCCLLMGWQ